MSTLATPGSASFPDNPLNINLDSKLYSNICKRMAAHLRSEQGVELSHTQMRTAMSAALGFDSPNALDALLKEKDALAKKSSGASGAAKASTNNQKLSEEATAAGWIARRDALREQLKGLTVGNAEDVTIDLLNVSLALLAERFPATLSSTDMEKIKANSPSITEASAAERAMSEMGVKYALALAGQSGAIALDYFADSNCKAAKDNDESHRAVISEILAPALGAAFRNAVKAGLSPFGAATTMILIGAVSGVRQGVHWTAMARPLLETIQPISNMTLEQSAEKPQGIPKEAEEELLKKIMQQMGVSRAQAKKYLVMAQQNMTKL